MGQNIQNWSKLLRHVDICIFIFLKIQQGVTKRSLRSMFQMKVSK